MIEASVVTNRKIGSFTKYIFLALRLRIHLTINGEMKDTHFHETKRFEISLNKFSHAEYPAANCTCKAKLGSGH